MNDVNKFKRTKQKSRLFRIISGISFALYLHFSDEITNNDIEYPESDVSYEINQYNPYNDILQDMKNSIKYANKYNSERAIIENLGKVYYIISNLKSKNQYNTQYSNDIYSMLNILEETLYKNGIYNPEISNLIRNIYNLI